MITFDTCPTYSGSDQKQQQLLPTDSLRYGTIKPLTVILGIDLFTASVWVPITRLYIVSAFILS